MKPLLKKTVASQPSWIIRSKDVELAVTQLGGHMAPVTFYRRHRSPVQPYYISPWAGEKQKIGATDAVLRPLRGDFFCAPFGANAESFRGEKHPLHGEPASGRWTFVAQKKADDVTSLTLSMKTKTRAGKITKTLALLDGHNVVYCRHVLEGYSGQMPLGHHPCLAVGSKEGTLRVGTSAFRIGRTNPGPTANPAEGSYESFATDKKFSDLRRVPLLWKDPPYADCTSFPGRVGFTDLLAVYKKPTGDPSWTAATDAEGGYLWFSLKDSAVLPATIFWISNCGRHEAPWSGRNRCLGLEDVCAYFAEGLAPSVRPNPISRAGIPTAVKLSPKRPTAINYIQGVVKTPRGFEMVKDVRFAKGRVTFISTTGKKVSAAVRYEFLQTGEL